MVQYKFTDTTDIKDAPMSTSLLAKLQRDILTGQLRPGQKLTEQEICSKYEVSRTPVREALRQLEADGLVENIRNRGAFVIGMSPQDIEDIFEMRKAGEMQAVTWAIQRITDEEMEQLEENFEFMEFYTMRNDYDKMLVINNGFHELIYEASHNRMLIRQLNSYKNYLRYQTAEEEKANRLDANYLHTILEEHRQIFKAFKDGDSRAGAMAMEIHINRARERRCG